MISTIKGEKLGMTSVFDGAGTTLAVTLVRPCPAVVTQLKTPENDGYSALQLAYGETLPKHVNKPSRGILNRAGVKGAYHRSYEVRVPEGELNNYKLGQEINPSEFLLRWATVDIAGTSKGKGFAGVVKRWGFRGQCRSHGDPDNRRPGSSGGTDAARVFKGARRPGQMGNACNTIKACHIFEYYRALNLLIVQGSLPGPTGGELTITVTREFTPEELAEHEALITLDEEQQAMFAGAEKPKTAEADVVKTKAETKEVEVVREDEVQPKTKASSVGSALEEEGVSEVEKPESTEQEGR